ncbi:MAG: phosphoribosylglycinamide formyltransferase [Bacteroidetes bacterium]|nr:MAG: phosphoribosylglycinamide formyltransferase [Bacteroidota bacterium]
MLKKKNNVAIFASGSGTNAQNMIEYFRNHDAIKISLIVSNNPDAFVLKRAEKEKMPKVILSGKDWEEKGKAAKVLQDHQIDFIVLAGYLRLLPSWLIRQYPGKIVNIHPALLPAYGGKGMYGEHVHRAVIASGDKQSGISIHLVNEEYDKGAIIFQARCPVLPSDTPETLAARIHELEYEHYPRVVEKVIMSNLWSVTGNG